MGDPIARGVQVTDSKNIWERSGILFIKEQRYSVQAETEDHLLDAALQAAAEQGGSRAQILTGQGGEPHWVEGHRSSQIDFSDGTAAYHFCAAALNIWTQLRPTPRDQPAPLTSDALRDELLMWAHRNGMITDDAQLRTEHRYTGEGSITSQPLLGLVSCVRPTQIRLWWRSHRSTAGTPSSGRGGWEQDSILHTDWYPAGDEITSLGIIPQIRVTGAWAGNHVGAVPFDHFKPIGFPHRRHF